MDARAPIAETENKPGLIAGAPRRRRGWVILLILLIVIAGAVVWRLRTAPQQNAGGGRFGRDAPTQIVAKLTISP